MTVVNHGLKKQVLPWPGIGPRAVSAAVATVIRDRSATSRSMLTLPLDVPGLWIGMVKIGPSTIKVVGKVMLQVVSQTTGPADGLVQPSSQRDLKPCL